MELKKILEELRDKPSRVVYHFTNLKSLYGILSKGGIEAKDYDVGYGKKEIAVVRPSSNYSKVPSELSAGDKDVKIILYPDKIKDTVRNFKIIPLAEFPSSNLINLKKNFSTKIDDKDINKIVSIIIKNKDKSATSLIDLFLNEGLAKKHPQLKNLHFLLNLKYRINNLIREMNDREGEERIVVSKQNKNLKKNYLFLDPRTMKIEINSGVENDFSYVLHKDITPRKFLNKIKKYDNLFIHNNYYDIFIKRLKEEEKKLMKKKREQHALL